MSFSKLKYLLLLYVMISNTKLISEENLDNDLENLLRREISHQSIYNQKISETPNSTIIVTAEEIKLFGFNKISELVATLQGLFVRSDLNYDFVGTRGFERPSNFNNNLILLNGHVLNELVYGSQSLDNYIGIDINDVSRVEIVLGPSSLFYGSGGLVSLINIILKDNKEANGLNLGMRYSNYNDIIANTSYGANFGDLSFMFTARAGKSDGKDYFFPEYADSTSDGIARNLDGERHYGTSLQISYKDLVLNAYFVNREKDIPSASYDSDFGAAGSFSRDERAFINLNYTFSLDENKTIKTRLFSDIYNYYDAYIYDGDPTIDENHGFWFGADIDFNWDISSNNRFMMGISATRVNELTYKLFNSSEMFFESDIPYNMLSFYIYDNYQVARNLSVNFGLRTDYLSYYYPNYNPRFAVNYNPTDETTIKYIFNTGFRSPSNYELFADDTSFKKLNENLKPEYLISHEINFTHNLNDFIFYNIAFFHNKFRDVIELVNIANVDEDPIYISSNIFEYDSYGFEIASRGKVSDALFIYANFTYQRSLDSTKKQIINSPEIMLKGGISYKFSSNLYFSFNTRYESSRKTLKLKDTEPFFISDFNIGYSPNFDEQSSFSFLNNLLLGLKINNIFDSIYYLPSPNWIKADKVIQSTRTITMNFQVKV